MPAPILTTKLFAPPPRPGMVSRPHLIARLNEGLAADRKLTLISASAGFGKTSLLGEWISTSAKSRMQNDEMIHAIPHSAVNNLNFRAAWLSLEESDSEPLRFLDYLIAALQTIQPELGQPALTALQSSQPPPVEDMLTGLLNEIANLSEKLILILDDYHVINTREVDDILAFMLDHLPPQLHVIIASREDPNLPLARLRARSQLTELRAADLRFTPAEAAEFFNRAMDLNLSETDVTSLEVRTEGWIAGLQLAALSMQGKKDPAAFIQSFTGSHHFVLDYLLEEVLHHQPENIQNFLLRTSLLNRLCGSLCEAVLGEAALSGQATLEALEHANLFIVPLDSERHWYRYHHLFGDLLRQRLGIPKELPQYHLRASAWFEAHGDLAEAFHHAIAAEDFDLAARLTEAAWPGMEGSFQSAAWLSWVKKLPERVVRSLPRLCYQLGRAFSDLGEPETSEIHLRNAECALAKAPEPANFATLAGDISLTRAYNAQVKGNITETIQYAELALSLIAEEDIYRRAQAVIMLEFTHWASGYLEAALNAILLWMDDMRKLGNLIYEIASVFALADLLVALGRLDEAEQALRQAIQQTAGQGIETEAITAHHHLGLALLAHERCQDEAIATHLQTAADLGQRTTLVDWSHRWKLAQARLKYSAGEWEEALELFDEAGRVYVKNPVPIARPVEALKARIHLKQGRRDKAEAWARKRDISLANEASYLAEYELLTLARLWLDDLGVNDLLKRLLTLAETQNRQGSVLEILLTQALAFQAQGRQPQAFAALERALTLAEPQGYLRTFVDEGEEMRLLMVDFRQHAHKVMVIEKQPAHSLFGYLDRLLASFPKSEIPNPKTKIEVLSPRELEILRLVSLGLSNTEISQQLYLALSTVKGHNLRIFDKLHVQNRTEAIVRARELGLL